MKLVKASMEVWGLVEASIEEDSLPREGITFMEVIVFYTANGSEFGVSLEVNLLYMESWWKLPRK